MNNERQYHCPALLCGRMSVGSNGMASVQSRKAGNLTLYMLYALMLQVGLSIGSSKDLKFIVGSLRPKYLLIPLGTVCGTLLFSALASLLLSRWSIFDCMAVGSGFAYYSLSSILITQFKEPSIGLQLATELGYHCPAGKHLPRNDGTSGHSLTLQIFRETGTYFSSGSKLHGRGSSVDHALFRQRHDACRHFPRHPDRHERSVFCISILPAVELSAGCLRVFKNFYTFGPLTKKIRQSCNSTIHSYVGRTGYWTKRELSSF